MAIIIFRNGQPKFSSTGGSLDGEKIPGDLDGWKLISSDPNEALRYSYGTLVDRSSTLYHTYPFASASIEKQLAYTIGQGLLFRSHPAYWHIPYMSRAKAKDWGREFQRIVYFYCKQLKLYGKQAVAFRGARATGEALLWFIRDDKGLLDDILLTSSNEIDWHFNDDSHTLGIFHDKFKRPLGFRQVSTEKDIAFSNEKKIPSVLRLMFQDLPDQIRGWPLIYKIIHSAKQDDRHYDATLARAVLEATQVGYFEGTGADPYKQAEKIVSATTQQPPKPKTGLLERIGNVLKMGIGNIYTVKEGGGLKFTDLKTPSNNFGTFKEWMLKYTGAALNTPPEVILSQYSTSYTAHMGAVNDHIKVCNSLRTDFINNFWSDVIKEIAADAILKGYISAPGFFENQMIQYAYLQGSYLGPVKGTINPVQEVTALSKAVEEGFILRADAASQMSNIDFEDALEERRQQEKDFADTIPKATGELPK